MPPVPTHQDTTDAELIALTLAGQDKAFRHLVNRYVTLVFNVIYRMTGNHELSEEMTQETFVKAYNHLQSFDRARPFRPWLLRIATNSTVTALRKQSKVVSLSAMLEENTWNEADYQERMLDYPPVEDTLSRLERKLSSEEVMKVLATLDEKYRQVLVLRYTQDLSYEEIAETLNIPLNTVRTWIKRGLERLKSQVKEFEP